MPPLQTVYHHVTKAYLQHFLLLNTSQLGVKKNFQDISKDKTQFEDTEQASEQDIASVLELSDQKFKTTMIRDYD